MSETPPHDHLEEPVSAHMPHMQGHPVALRPDQTVGEALQFLRTCELGERIVYFYVVDADDRLVGVVPTRRLLVSPAERSVASLMVGNLVTLRPTMSVREALSLLLAHRFMALPVVDEGRRLLGVVDISGFTDDLSNLAERQSYEDLFQLVGVHLLRDLTPWRAFANRFPWLLCNVGGGLLAAAIASRYEALLDAVLVLALFIPVVLALSESVGMQAVTLTLQRLHAGPPGWRFFIGSLRTELATAALLGVACGGGVGAAAWLWQGVASVAAVIAATIALAMITACAFGVVLPVALRALRRDPRIAAGPVVLALADVATLLLYFNIAGKALQ
jgi:magnesium transporter